MSGTAFTAQATCLWVESRPELGSWGAVRSVAEIGDGNLNQVFRVNCEEGSLIVKQSMPFVRIDPTWPLTPERIEHEALSYAQWNKLMPQAGPQLYSFDRTNHVMAVQDLRAHRVWRTELQVGNVHAGSAVCLGSHVADAANLLARKELELQPGNVLEQARNPVMTQLMHDVIFTFPYVEHPHNRFPPDVAGVVAEVRGDARYAAARELLEDRWQSAGDALIHGDLHTGSVMVLDSDVRMIDAEFSWLGPVSWDLGEMIGNLLIAAIHGRVTRSPAAAELDGLAAHFWAGFTRRCDELDGDRAAALLAPRVRAEVVGYAGLEMVRRVIGSGKAEEIEELAPAQQAVACEAMLRVGAELVRHHADLEPEGCLGVIDAVLP